MPTIGVHALSGHAPVYANWRVGLVSHRPHQWWLNNFLLEAPRIVGLVNREVENCFLENTGLAPAEDVWDTFKAYWGGGGDFI